MRRTLIICERDQISKAYAEADMNSEQAALRIQERISIPAYRGISVKQCFKLDEAMRQWSKEASGLIAWCSQDFLSLQGSDRLLSMASVHLGGTPYRASAREEARLGLLGQVSANKERSCFINLSASHCAMAAGDSHRLDGVWTLSSCQSQVLQLATILKRDGQLTSLPMVLHSYLAHTLERLRSCVGKIGMVGLDGTSTRLLQSLLGQDLSQSQVTHRAHASLAANFEDLVGAGISLEDVDYWGSRLVLISCLMEWLEADSCRPDDASQATGFIVVQAGIEPGNHIRDWWESACEALLRREPERFTHGCRKAFLAGKLFDSMRGWLHNWGARERMLLMLGVMFDEPPLEELLGLDQTSCKLLDIMSKIALSEEAGNSYGYLDELVPSERSVGFRLAVLAQMVRSLDATGRNAVQDLSLEPLTGQSDAVVLRLHPQLDVSAELAQLRLWKRSFESQFQQRLEVEIIG